MTITIVHIDGPLKGQTQSFDDTVSAITFGRDREVAQIVYPPEYDVVGRRHFELRRTKSGDYTVELFGSRYVEMNGTPVDNGATVTPDSTFRLGRKDGPAFKVEIGASSADGLPVTGDQRKMTTSTQRLGRTVAVAGGALALVAAGIFGTLFYLSDTLFDQISLVRMQAAAQSAQAFRQAELSRLQDAVYIVARREGGGEEAEGTAWAFARGNPDTGEPGRLATNAHVTEAIRGHEGEFFLVGPDGENIAIETVISHPGYATFKDYKKTQGTTRWGAFTPLDLINEYDVGIIEVSPAAKLPTTLEIASPRDLDALSPGTPVAVAGFPVEGLAGADTATQAPSTLQFGHISALMDVFMVRADPEHRLLIQHSVPVTGGVSGSPLMTPGGKVVGIVNGGNTTVLNKTSEALNAKVRVPSAALVNFAQRADLLAGLAPCRPHELAEKSRICRAESELETHKAYWDVKGAQFEDYFNVAKENFVTLARSRYNVAEAKETVIADGAEARLDGGGSHRLVSKAYSVDVEPGKIYGFIADSKSGVPMGINLKDEATSTFLRDEKDPRKTSELELAPTAWISVDEPQTIEVIVWSLVAQPADYALFAYEWRAPAPSANAGS